MPVYGYVVEIKVDGRWTRNAPVLSDAPVYDTEDEAAEAAAAVSQLCDGSFSGVRVRAIAKAAD